MTTAADRCAHRFRAPRTAERNAGDHRLTGVQL